MTTVTTVTTSATTATTHNEPGMDNPYLTGNFAPVSDELTITDLPVTGTIPDGLDGRFLRIGPNPVSAEDPSTYHWFTGTGMAHGLRLRHGKAEWYRNRFVRSDRVTAAKGWPEVTGPRHGPGDGTANTNLVAHAGRTLAIVEAGGLPVELDYGLDTVARTDFQATLPGSFTAHPKRDPLTGELHAVTYYWEWDHLRYLVVGTDGRVRKCVEIPVPDGPMVHDMAFTTTQILLLDLPVTFDLEAAMNGAALPYRWNPDHRPRVGLLPRTAETGTEVTWCDVEPCFVYHILNAYDSGSEVVADVIRHPKMFATDMLGPNEGVSTLERWTINPTTGRVHERRLDDRGQEFPRHDERLIGVPHRYGYTAAVESGVEHGPALKHDLVTATTEIHDYGKGRVTLEPVFVPRHPGAAEDDGWILSYVYDATTDKSDVVILAAQDFGGDPVATIHLPRRVPFGFHGNWVPDNES